MRVLHWSTAVLLLGPYLAVWAIGRIASEADAVWLAMLHRSFGPLARAVFVLHGWTGMALLGLIGLHVLAALHHHFVRRDTVLVSMLPATRNFAAPGSADAKYAPIGGGPS